MTTFHQQNIHPVLSLTLDLLAEPAISPNRKARLRQDARKYQFRDRLACRAELKQDIDYCKTSDGFVYVENFSRDCDNFERNLISKVPAHITALELHENRLHDGAEGLTFCNLLDQEAVDSFQSMARDRNAERYGY